jgi:hypothetical protein
MSALILKDKSISNIKAALLLYENEYYSSSVHCYYYSSLQFTIFTLINKFGRKYPDLKREARKTNNSHEYYINQLADCISDPTLSRSFNNTINTLKRMRIEADYEPIKTVPSLCEIAKKHNLLIEQLINTI